MTLEEAEWLVPELVRIVRDPEAYLRSIEYDPIGEKQCYLAQVARDAVRQKEAAAVNEYVAWCKEHDLPRDNHICKKLFALAQLVEDELLDGVADLQKTVEKLVKKHDTLVLMLAGETGHRTVPRDSLLMDGPGGVGNYFNALAGCESASFSPKMTLGEF